MTGWLNPPHDRVTLTDDERETLDRLERALAAEAHPSAAGTRSAATSPCEAATRPARHLGLASLGIRCRALAACLRLVGPAPLLLPIGAVVMCLGLSTSVVVCVLGVVISAIGLAACTARPWARHPVAYLRGQRTRGW